MDINQDGFKRPTTSMVQASHRRSHHELIEAANALHIDKRTNENGPPRTSSLAAPIMLLTGHQGEIFTCKFHPDGQTLASSGFDRQIFLWNTYGECENYSILGHGNPGHTGAVLQLHYSADGNRVFTCSADKSLMVWDVVVGGRVKKFSGHTAVVNSCDVSRNDSRFLCSGSDDKSVRLWDLRSRKQVENFKENYQILSVAFSEKADQIFVAGLENNIKVYDLRNQGILYALEGHYDSVTGLALSPDGSHLLSNSMDNTLQIWDVRPYAPPNRFVRSLQGNVHNFEKNLLRCNWSPDGTYVTAGSSDRHVYVWNAILGNIVYKLPGHLGSVNEVVFHPNEPIVLSASSDKQLYLGELEL